MDASGTAHDLGLTPPGGREASHLRQRRATRGHLLPLLLVALAALVAAACESPPPDGRDLGIEVVGAPDGLDPGQQSSFDVVVTNQGTVDATASTFVHLAPGHVTVDSVTGPAVGECGPLGTLGACELGTLDAGASTTLTVTVTGGPSGGTGELALAVTSDGAEPSPDANANLIELPIFVGPVDLQVHAELDPRLLVADRPFTSRTWVSNRSARSASDVVVTQQLPPHVTITDSRFTRALPGGGTAEGTCTAAESGMVTCTTDGAPIEATTDPSQRWAMEVDAIGPDWGQTIDIVHSVTSPHPEPVPDPGPNTATTSDYVGYGAINFDPVDPVRLGTEFEVTGTGFSNVGIPGSIIRVSPPPGIEAISVTIGGTTVACDADGRCDSDPYAGVLGEVPVKLRLRAVGVGGPAEVQLSIATSGLGVGGATYVEVFDPALDSELHPHLDERSDLVTDVQTTLHGQARNTGATDVGFATATFQLPANLEVHAARWGIADLPCAIAGDTVICSLSTVRAGTNVDLAVDVTPTAPGPALVHLTTRAADHGGDPDPIVQTTSVELGVRSPFVDLGVEWPTDLVNPAVEHADWRTRPTVQNHGSIPAEEVRVLVTLPSWATPASARIPDASRPADSQGCTVVGRVVDCHVGTLGPDGIVPVDILSDVVPGEVEDLAVTVTSAGEEHTPDPHPNQASVAVHAIPAHADMYGELTVWPDRVIVGQPTDIRLLTINGGPSTVPSSTGTLELPPGWTVLEVDTPAWRPCQVTGTSVTCVQSTPLDPGRGWAVTVLAVPDELATAAPLTYSVASPIVDPDPSNDTGTRLVDVIPAEADLGLRFTGPSDGTMDVGALGYLRLAVINSGPDPADDVVATTTLPAGFQIVGVSTSSTGFTCAIAGQTVTCTRDLVYVTNTTTNITITVRPQITGSFTVDAHVSASSSQGADVVPNDAQVALTVD